MKKHNDQKINLVLDDMLESFKLKGKINQTRVVNCWKEVMGATISRYTRTVRLSKSKLYITIDSGPLKQDLVFGKEKIKEKINAHLGEDCVKEVIIR